MKFKTIYRTDEGMLLEGFVRGDVTGAVVSIEGFTVESAEDREGNPVETLREIPTRLLCECEGQQLEAELREHAAENEKVDGDRPYRVALAGRLVDVYVKKLSRPAYGYFNHETGDGEPPSGPEADILLVRDAETDETIAIDEIPEADYEALVQALVEEDVREEAERDAELAERDEPDYGLDEAV